MNYWKKYRLLMITLVACLIELSARQHILTSLIILSTFVWNTSVILKLSLYGIQKSNKVTIVYKSLLKNNPLKNRDKSLIKTYIRFLSLFKN